MKNLYNREVLYEFPTVDSYYTKFFNDISLRVEGRRDRNYFINSTKIMNHISPQRENNYIIPAPKYYSPKMGKNRSLSPILNNSIHMIK